MSNVQIIQCQKPGGGDGSTFNTVDEAMSQHTVDCTAMTSVTDYKAWVEIQPYSETYALMSDKSGYEITRTWASEADKNSQEAIGTPGNDRAQLSSGGWDVTLKE